MTAAEYRKSVPDCCHLTSEPNSDQDASPVVQDRELVDRCLSGESRAWDSLYQKYHPVLCGVLKSLLNARSGDDHLVEEIAARVWYGLVRDKGRRLGRFDDTRGYRLSTFLAAFAKRELLQHFRSEQRRRSRERSASLSPISSDPSNPRPGDILVEEFLHTLTPREREFFQANLLGSTSDDDTPHFSTTNIWQLRHRVQRKLRAFLREE